MTRILKLALISGLVLAVTAAVALAGLFTPGRYTGTSEDDEPVAIRVTDSGTKVIRFKVDQGVECGVTKYSKRHNPDIMPVKIEDGRFTIKDKIGDIVIFKVKGAFQTTDEIAGHYDQVACDGDPDTFTVFAEGTT